MRAVMIGLALAASGCLRLDWNMFDPRVITDKTLDQMQSDEHVTSPSVCPEGETSCRRIGPAVGTYEEIWLKTGAGVDFNGYLVRPDPPESDRKVWMLYCHGNSRHVGQYRDRVVRYQKLGFTVFVFDYEGYGKAGGKPTEQGLYDTVRAARTFVEGHPDRAGAPVVVYGWSLGGVPAIFSAAEQTPAALVLEAAFASPARFAEFGSFLDMPPGWLMDLKMDNESRIKEVRAPVLVFHGEEDAFVEIKHGELIVAKANPPAELVRVAGANHGNVVEQGGRAYLDKLNEFLQAYLPAH